MSARNVRKSAVRKTDAKKILVLRFSSLGDIVMTTAMVRALRKRFPSAQIDMVVRRDFLDVIKHNPHLNQKIGLDRKEGWRGLFRMARAINQEKYDLIYDAHRSLRTLLLMPFLKAPEKAYYKKHYVRRNLALLFKLPLLKKSKRFLEKFIEPLARYGVSYDGLGPEMVVAEEARASAFAKFPSLKEATSLVGIVPSAQWRGKRWPLPYFRSLLKKLLIQNDSTYVIFGGPSDTFCENIYYGLPVDHVVNTQGKLSIAECAAVIEKCDYVIANDTGLMHVADALNIPTLSFLGPTSGELGCLPFHRRSVILEKDLWCRPCSKNGQAPCIRAKRYCLTDITPDEAFSAAVQLHKAISSHP